MGKVPVAMPEHELLGWCCSGSLCPSLFILAPFLLSFSLLLSVFLWPMYTVANPEQLLLMSLEALACPALVLCTCPVHLSCPVVLVVPLLPSQCPAVA